MHRHGFVYNISSREDAVDKSVWSFQTALSEAVIRVTNSTPLNWQLS